MMTHINISRVIAIYLRANRLCNSIGGWERQRKYEFGKVKCANDKINMKLFTKDENAITEATNVEWMTPRAFKSGARS